MTGASRAAARPIRRALRTLLAGGALLGSGAVAQAGPGWPSLDKAVAVTRQAGGSGLHARPDVVCTAYDDLTVVERGTDTPNPEAARLVARRAGRGGGCGDGRTGRRLPTANYGFVGRRGPFLVFEEADPQGAIPFKVLDAATGRLLFEDATKAGIVQWLAAGDEAITLHYARGVNAPCSLLKDGAACWATIRDNSPVALPDARAVAAAACRASYATAKAAPPDPSLVSYGVTVRVDRTARVRSQARLPVGCEPQP